MDIRSLLMFGVVGLAVFLVLMVVVLSRVRVCNGPVAVGNSNESDYLKFSSDMFPNSYRCIVIEAPLVAGNSTPATVLRDHWFRVLWCFFALFVSFNLFAQIYTVPFPTVPIVLSNSQQFGVQDVRFSFFTTWNALRLFGWACRAVVNRTIICIPVGRCIVVSRVCNKPSCGMLFFTPAVHITLMR